MPSQRLCAFLIICVKLELPWNPGGLQPNLTSGNPPKGCQNTVQTATSRPNLQMAIDFNLTVRRGDFGGSPASFPVHDGQHPN